MEHLSGAEETALTQRAPGWPEEEPSRAPLAVPQRMAELRSHGEWEQEDWQRPVAAYRELYRQLCKGFRRLGGQLSESWDQRPSLTRPSAWLAARRQVCVGRRWRLPCPSSWAAMPTSPPRPIPESGTTPASKRAVAALATCTSGSASTPWVPSAMGSAIVADCVHTRPPASSFSDSMRPGIRPAGLNWPPVLFVFSHDSIGLGDDGCTYQPVEHLTSRRAITDLVARLAGTPRGK